MTSELSIPIEDYHGMIDSLSKTGASMLLRSPSCYYKHFCAPIEDREFFKDSPSTRLGNMVHTLTLEPGEFPSRYAVVSSKTRLTKAFKEAAQKNKLITVTDTEYEQACRMRDAILSHSGARQFLRLSGKAESSFVWEERGVLLKCRPDFLSDDSLIVVDLKTTRDGSPEGFKREADNFKYWLSAAMTLRGVETVRGIRPESYVFLCVENTGEKLPEVSLYYATDEEIRLGNHYLDKAIELFKRCRESGKWPGYSPKAEPLGLPYYRRRELETACVPEVSYVS